MNIRGMAVIKTMMASLTTRGIEILGWAVVVRPDHRLKEKTRDTDRLAGQIECNQGQNYGSVIFHRPHKRSINDANSLGFNGFNRFTTPIYDGIRRKITPNYLNFAPIFYSKPENRLKYAKFRVIQGLI